jgi:hypothetical protein
LSPAARSIQRHSTGSVIEDFPGLLTMRAEAFLSAGAVRFA